MTVQSVLAPSFPYLFRCPAEVTELILLYLDPFDVAHFAQSCRYGRDIVYRSPDQQFWKGLLLQQQSDDPRASLSATLTAHRGLYPAIHWQWELTRRVLAERHARSYQDLTPSQRVDVLETIVSVIMDSPPLFVDGNTSKNCTWATQLLEECNMFRLSPMPWAPSDRERQLLAQLRVFMGMSKEDLESPQAIATRTAARCFVYNLRNYQRETLWGPYLPSGQVNWQHVEAMRNVLSMNMKDLEGSVWFPSTRPPLGVESTRPYSAPDLMNRHPLDWAGVTGQWRRVVCFMDYRDLFDFNYAETKDAPARDSSYFYNNPTFQEASRFIELDLQVTRVGDYKFVDTPDSPSWARSEAHELMLSRPTIHFAGVSRGGHNNEAKIRGYVKMTDDGNIRWKFVSASIYEGHTQWSSEGVQIGNVGSGIGIIGAWTSDLHEDGDPAGPFWLWKVPDSFPRLMS